MRRPSALALSSSSASPTAEGIERATATPTASGTIAAMSGSDPVTPVAPSISGPRNWQVA